MKTPDGTPARSHGLSRLVLLAGAVLLAAPAAVAQEPEHAAEAGHSEHAEGLTYRHVVTVSAGAATHTERNDTGGAVGLSYGYVLSHQWVVGLKLEYASSRLERDFVILPGVVFEPVERVEFGLSLGVERAEKQEAEHGETHTVTEDEALVRMTFAYAFHLGARTALVPEFNTDITASGVTYVYGLAFSVGL